MTRKSPRASTRTRSSSFGRTAQSRQLTEVLGLGRELVRELGLEPSTDTLGRWMAHHVAALIDDAEHGSTPAQRQRSAREAVETILAIWRHRATLPGQAYPLSAFKLASSVIGRLLPRANPFRDFSPASPRQRAATSLFDSMAHLVLLLLAIEAGLGRGHAGRRMATALTRSEREALSVFHEWADLLGPQENAPESGHEPTTDAQLDIKSTGLAFCDRAQQALDEVRAILSEA